MADKTQKVPENVPGKWYVDDTCVPCHTCLEEAPNLYFFKQPTNPEEEDAAARALDICPSGSIGDDGDS
jgi:ferredoxin